jgi:hypothetical protein
VTEHGQEGKLTAGATIEPTVSGRTTKHAPPTNTRSTTSKTALP